MLAGIGSGRFSSVTYGLNGMSLIEGCVRVTPRTQIYECLTLEMWQGYSSGEIRRLPPVLAQRAISTQVRNLR